MILCPCCKPLALLGIKTYPKSTVFILVGQSKWCVSCKGKRKIFIGIYNCLVICAFIRLSQPKSAAN
jgi:hypothetical protein